METTSCLPAVLERARELAALESLIGSLAEGGEDAGRTLVIEGQAGLGKSTLLAQIAPRDGLRVLQFSCGELERQLAWAGAVGLLAPALAELDPERRARLLEGPAAAAAPLLHEAGDGTDADSQGGFDVIAALQRILAALAEDAALLLVIDDAHWCDRASLRFLAYAQRRLPDLPAGLVLATRPPSGERAHRPVLERIMNAPATEVLTLSPLGPSSVARLVREHGLDDADAGFCDTCWEVTAGNPFYVHELLRELGHRGLDARRTLDVQELSQVTPPAVLRSVVVGLDRIPAPGAQELAASAAVLGTGGTLRQAAALAGLDGAVAADALDALAGAEILAPGEPLRFVHPLVQGGIYTSIPAARRARAHAQAAALLAADHAAPEVVALHLLHAPQLADPATVAGLRAGAARAQTQGAPRSAVRLLRRALQEPPPPELRADVLIELAHAEAAAGDGQAVGHLRDAVGLTVEPRRRAELEGELGWVEHSAGRFAAAAEAFERGLELLVDRRAPGVAGAPDATRGAHEPGDGLERRLEAGYLVAATLDADRAADANSRIRAIESDPAEIRGPAERMLLAQVLFLRLVSGAPREQVIELAQRIWVDGRMLTEDRGRVPPEVWNVIGALSWCDDYAAALRAIEQTLAVAESRGLVLAEAQARYARAWPRMWMGELRGAQADAHAAIEIWDGGLETYLPAAVYWFGRASLELGEAERAGAALARVAERERWEGTAMAGFIHALEGHLHAHRGDLAAAVESHRACGEAMSALMVTNSSVMPWRSQAARALCGLGRTDEARRLAAEELAAALGCGAPRAIGVARAALGMCATGEEGIAALTQAAEELAACGAHGERMHVLVDLGAAIRRAGRPRAARPALREGLELAQRAGAVVVARRAETELRAAGGRGRRATDGGPSALTACERRVAELAARGHANRDIAGMLRISVKGVEWHLHQSYRKLDIRGRAQLGAALGDPDAASGLAASASAASA